MGGNLGDVEATLHRALRALEQALGPLRVSPLYRSRAVSSTPQPDYLNTVALGRTSLGPEIVLALAKRLELMAGRRRGERDQPRPLDVDLLLYGHRVSQAPELTLPHPRLRQRRFVLAPLADIAPELAIPPDGRQAASLLAEAGREEEVRKVEWKAPRPDSTRPGYPAKGGIPG